MSAVVLLIEDTAADAGRFTRQIKEKVGDDVHVVWCRTLGEAKRHLASIEVDQIWIDMGDFADRDISHEIAHLKQFVPDDQFFMLGAVSTTLRTQAQNQNVQIVSKDGLRAKDPEQSQILQIVLEMLQKRSSGATTKVDLAKQGVQLLHLEGKVERMETLFEDLRVGLQMMSTKIQEQGMELKAIQAAVQTIAQKLPEVEKKVNQRESGDTLRIERWKVLGTIIGGLLAATATVIVAMTQFVVPKMIEQKGNQIQQQIQQEVKPSPPASPALKK